jgi:hypothetical protein
LVFAAILAVFLTSRAVGIEDARRMYGGYISDPLPRAEDHFVRDLLLRPKTADFEDRWLGGAHSATNWFATAQRGEDVTLDQALAEMLSAAQATTGTVDVQVYAVTVLISALGQAARYAIKNDYMQTAMICVNLLAQYGLELRGLNTPLAGQVTLDAQDLRLTSAVLHLTADRLEDHQWKPLNGEDRFATSVIRVLPTPRTLGVSDFLGSCGVGVLYVSWSLFPDGVRVWFLLACRGGVARGSTVRGPLARGGSSFPAGRGNGGRASRNRARTR